MSYKVNGCLIFSIAKHLELEKSVHEKRIHYFIIVTKKLIYIVQNKCQFNGKMGNVETILVKTLENMNET